MEVRYLYSEKKTFEFAKWVGKSVYKGNQYLKIRSCLDLLIYWCFYVFVFFLFFQFREHQDYFEYYYENTMWQWLSWGFLISGLIVIGYSVFIRIHLTEKARFSVMSARDEGHQIYLRLDEDGLYQQTDYCHSTTYYPYIDRVLHIKQHLIIVLNKAYFYAIPYSAFTDNAELLAFERALKQKMGRS
ncbi:YcxB family protein [Glaesserella sp.]|uniref:YcxB family protein n=1 Tax=Glaesserella sp. TaxID=2094731 RepID=UPI00359F6DEB